VSVRYVLAPRAIAARARIVAASGAAIAVAPAWLVVVLVAQLGLASRAVTLGLAVAIGLLGALRASLEYVRARKRLAALAVVVDGEELVVTTLRAEMRVPAAGIARVVDIDGAYGGLRVELVDGSEPARFDVPRGGDAFGEVRSWLAARVTIERAPRRSRAARIALVAGVVLALFFVPFVVADARGSRVAVAIVLLVAWGAMRFVPARS
jgi:hypothetical protein